MSAGPALDVAAFRSQVEAIRKDAAELGAGLSAVQLRWRPGPESWGIADCLEHLNSTGGWYLTQIDRGVAEARERGLTSGGPFRMGLFERWAVASVEPPVRRIKVKARPLFLPQGQDALRQLPAFQDLQERVLERLDQADGLDLKRARTRSPVSRLLGMTLGGCIAVLLAHERRHLWQARRVRQQPGFPAAGP